MSYFTSTGESDQMPGVETGDVVILLQQIPHETFTRSHDDLFLNKKIRLVEALCGVQIVVKHLDGRDLVLKREAGQIIRPGDVKKVEGEGMPRYKNPFEKGNLYAKFEVIFPEDNFGNEEVIKVSLSIPNKLKEKKN